MGLSPMAFAQTAPSRTVPETITPKVERTDAGVSLPETRLTAAPAGAENLSVRIDRVDVSGGLPQYADAVAQMARSFEGRTVTIAALYDLAARIEALYARDGFVLTRAAVPPQDLRDGATFRIVIVEGFIESIDDSAVPEKVRGPIRNRLTSMIGRKGLSLQEIERHVLLAARTPGVRLTTTLVPGEQSGGARLVLQAQHKPVNGGIGTDNMLSDAYDNWNFDAQVALNSLLGAGEQFYAVAATSSDFDLFEGRPMRRVTGLGYVMPIGNNGLSHKTEYLHAETNAKPATGGIAITGIFDRIATGFEYPLILRRQESLNISAGFEVVNEHQTATQFDVRLSEDRLRFLTLGIDWAKAVGARTSITTQAQFAQGFDAFGARNLEDTLADGVLLSRQGSEPDFSKFAAGLNVHHSLFGGLNTRFIIRGQTSLSGALPSAAQFSLDSREGLSGFSTGSINVDSGLTGRFELANRFALGTTSQATPYAFAAAGTGRLSQPTALELEHPDGWSLGGGVRSSFDNFSYLNAELSRSHSNIFSDAQTRLMVGAGIQF